MDDASVLDFLRVCAALVIVQAWYDKHAAVLADMHRLSMTIPWRVGGER